MARQSGFTLIEVLAAMSILSIGVIGIAGLQLAAHRSNQQSAYATLAVQLAHEMAERIRANAVASEVHYHIDTRNLSGPAEKACYGGVCTPEEMARFDVREWAQRLTGKNISGGPATGALPGARGVICRDSLPWKNSGGYEWACVADPGAPLVVKVGWLAKHADGSLAGGQAGGLKERPQIVLFAVP